MPFLELSVSVTLCIEYTSSTIRSLISSSILIDSRESSLSPATQELQQQIRERARERLADAESLHILESATAAKSINSKGNGKGDEGSQLSTQSTSVREHRGRSAQASMPARLVESQIYLDDSKKSRISSAPSFSTLVITGEPKLPRSGNEFENFMAREAGARVPLLRRNKSSSAVSPRLDVYPPGMIGTKSGAISECTKEQVDEVHEWFDRCKGENAAAEKDVENDIAKDESSPNDILTTSPKSEGALSANKDSEESTSDFGNEESKSSASKDATDQQHGAMSDEEGRESERSSEDEWEVV